MGGAVMEIGRMTMYMFVPIGMFYYFGLPAFNENFVRPFYNNVYPPEEATYKPPHSEQANRELLQRLIEERRSNAKEQ
eukprot:m.4740 g.4740  ORF g.4740 m.4740 type:complete len:78 (+) comp7168_c0_seq1:175-408(+)